MATDVRTRPDCYSEDGLPIYYSIYKEKDGAKLYMSFRLPKEKVKEGEPEYGKVLYEETHKLPREAEKASGFIQEALQRYAPNFWNHFFRGEESRRFLAESLNKKDGLPLAVAWAADQSEIAEQLNWKPKTVQRKIKVAERMIKLGWGAIPLGKLDAKFCGDTFLNDFTYNEQCAAVALLKQLCRHEIGHKRLSSNAWDESNVRRPAPPKKSSAYVNQHIRPDTIVKEFVHHIIDEMISLLPVKKLRNYAIALILCLAMGLPLGEVCYIRLAAIKCDGKNVPLTLHIAGTTRKKKKRIENEDYPETSPQNRILPIPTKVAMAIKPLLDEWRSQETEVSYQTRYLISHEKNSQRKSNFKDIEKWINQHLRKQLEDNRMHDGKGGVIHTRSPYRRCLSTARQSLIHVGFEPDEVRYFFGRSASSTAGEYYCDFANDAEQDRMRSLMDQWLGSPLPPVLCDGLSRQNPPADAEVAFGAKGQIALVILTLDIPPVPEELIPEDGYNMQFCARQGLYVNAIAQTSGSLDRRGDELC